MQDQGGNTVRFENPSERQGNRFDERFIRSWRPVCNNSDRSAKKLKSAGKTETERIRGNLSGEFKNSIKNEKTRGVFHKLKQEPLVFSAV